MWQHGTVLVSTVAYKHAWVSSFAFSELMTTDCLDRAFCLNLDPTTASATRHSNNVSTSILISADIFCIPSWRLLYNVCFSFTLRWCTWSTRTFITDQTVVSSLSTSPINEQLIDLQKLSKFESQCRLKRWVLPDGRWKGSHLSPPVCWLLQPRPSPPQIKPPTSSCPSFMLKRNFKPLVLMTCRLSWGFTLKVSCLVEVRLYWMSTWASSLILNCLSLP